MGAVNGSPKRGESRRKTNNETRAQLNQWQRKQAQGRWKKIALSVRGKRLSADTRKPRLTVREILEKLQVHNEDTNQLDTYEKWEEAKKILSRDPKLMMTFITITKSLSLKESEELVSITDSLVKMNVSGCVEYNQSGLLDSLFFSKTEKEKTSSADNSSCSTFVSRNSSTSNDTNERTHRMLLTSGGKRLSLARRKQRKISLAESIKERRKSMLPSNCKMDRELVNKTFSAHSFETPVEEFKVIDETCDDENE